MDNEMNEEKDLVLNDYMNKECELLIEDYTQKVDDGEDYTASSIGKVNALEG